MKKATSQPKKSMNAAVERNQAGITKTIPVNWDFNRSEPGVKKSGKYKGK